MLDEMKAFIGLHMLFSIKQLPATRLYWSADPLIGIPFVQKVTLRNCFDKLSKYFRLNNNANQIPRCKMELRPQKDLSVDEVMIKVKGWL